MFSLQTYPLTRWSRHGKFSSTIIPRYWIKIGFGTSIILHLTFFIKGKLLILNRHKLDLLHHTHFSSLLRHFWQCCSSRPTDFFFSLKNLYLNQTEKKNVNYIHFLTLYILLNVSIIAKGFTYVKVMCHETILRGKERILLISYEAFKIIKRYKRNLNGQKRYDWTRENWVQNYHG